jgi:hypothetical protein
VAGRGEKNEKNRKLGTNDNYLSFIVTWDKIRKRRFSRPLEL